MIAALDVELLKFRIKDMVYVEDAMIGNRGNRQLIRNGMKNINNLERGKNVCGNIIILKKGKYAIKSGHNLIKGKKCKRKYLQYMQDPEVKENYRNHHRKRRAMKKSVNYWLPFYDLMWQWMVDLTFGKCPVCGELFDSSNTTKCLTQDHIIPISKGGIHHIYNVQPMCLSCNDKKGNQTYIWR